MKNLIPAILFFFYLQHARALPPVYEAGVQKHIGHHSIGRIGVRVTLDGKVLYVHPESPAETEGIKVNDVITAVADQSGHIQDIEGAPGTYCLLSIKRGSSPVILGFIVKRVPKWEIKR